MISSEYFSRLYDLWESYTVRPCADILSRFASSMRYISQISEVGRKWNDFSLGKFKNNILKALDEFITLVRKDRLNDDFLHDGIKLRVDIKTDTGEWNVCLDQVQDGENCIKVGKQANKNALVNIDKPLEEMDNYEESNGHQRKVACLAKIPRKTAHQVKTRRTVTKKKGSKFHHHSYWDKEEEFGHCVGLIKFVFQFLIYIASKTPKPNKKVTLLFTILITSGLYLTNASPIQPKSGTNGLYKYMLLNTSQCNYLGLTEYQMCEQDDNTFNIFMEYCGYADQCGHGYEPVCAYDDEGQMLLFCSPTGLTCQKEIRRRVSRVDVDSRTVFVQEENCPPGRYRPRISICYGQCFDISDDVNELQELFRKTEAEYDVFDLDANVPDKKLSQSNEVYGTEIETDQNNEFNQIKWKPNGIHTQNLDADEPNVGKDWHVIIVVGLACAALLISVFGLVVLLKQ